MTQVASKTITTNLNRKLCSRLKDGTKTVASGMVWSKVTRTSAHRTTPSGPKQPAACCGPFSASG